MADPRRPRSTGDVVDALGFGRCNVLFVFLVSCCAFLLTLPHGSYKFAVHDTQYRCYVPECVDERYDHEWLWHAVPYERSKPSHCERFAPRPLSDEAVRRLELEADYACPRQIFDRSRRRPCTRWVFGERHSVVQEFDIPCRPDKIELFHLSGAVGRCVCFLFFGWLSDRYGRRRLLFASCLAASATGFAASLARAYELYLALHFLNAALGAGAFGVACVLAFESTPTARRVLVFTLVHVASATSAVCLGAIAIGASHWRLLYQVAHFPNLFNVVILLFVDESIAWTLFRRPGTVASKILGRVALNNNDSSSEELTIYLHNLMCRSSPQAGNDRGGSSEGDEEYKVKCLWERRARRLAARWVWCAACLAAATVVHDRLSTEIFRELGYEMHVNLVVTSCLDVLGVVASWVAMERLGVRASAGASLAAAFAACGALALVDDDKVQFIFAVQTILYVVTTSLTIAVGYYELQISPTTHRHTIFSWSAMVSSAAAVGGLLAPPLSRRCSYAVFSATCVCCLLLMYALPDLTGPHLYDTIAQGQGATLKKNRTSKISIISSSFEGAW